MSHFSRLEVAELQRIEDKAGRAAYREEHGHPRDEFLADLEDEIRNPAFEESDAEREAVRNLRRNMADRVKSMRVPGYQGETTARGFYEAISKAVKDAQQ